MRKPGNKNAERTFHSGQQISAIAQETLKLTVYLFHHRWRCTFDWDVMGVCEDTIHVLAGQMRLEASMKIQTCFLRLIRPIWQGQ